jgi:ankyrin repeat protein
VEALGHLPRGLSELLDQKFARVQTMHNTREAIKVLQWCGVARKALTTEEFREVLSISPGQNSLDRGSFPHDMDRIIADCCGLTFVEEEESTVHYVHHSVRVHLFAEHGPHSDQFNEVDVDKHLGYLCMTYLDFNDFKRQVAKVKQGPSPLLDPIKIGVGAVTYPSSISNRFAQRLLHRRRQPPPITAEELKRNAQEILGVSGASQLDSELEKRQFQFLDYARTYWIYHVTELDNMSHEKMWKLFCRCVDGNDVVAYRPWDTAGGQKYPGTSDWPNTAGKIQWTLAHGHNALLLHQALYHSSSITEEMKRNIFHHATIEDRCRYVEIMTQYTENTSETLAWALVDAAKEGRATVILMLITVGANVNAPAANGGRTALQAAAGGGHIEVVERLLAAKADVNAQAATYGGRTALQAAAGGGHLEVMERLLAAKADVNARAAARGGRTTLQAAAEGGHLEVVERLLTAKADINAPAAVYGRTALQAAAGGGHIEVVERLLAAKADVNAQATTYGGRTALQAAAGGGHLEVMERLLVAKADVNAQAATYGGRTALQAAAGGGHLEVVERLLAAKADINAPAAVYGRTALQAAAGGGHLEVMERLLAAKADVNAPATAYDERTALQAAAGGGHLEAVERLLAAKADVNARAAARGGRTALQAAAEGGHLEVVERLLAAKADVNAPAAVHGRTALQAAAEGGHLGAVERLLAAGADVNTPAEDYNGRTALQAAAEGGHLKVVERLLAAKVRVNTPAAVHGGRTALQAAAEGGHLEVVERLKNAGALY